MFAFRTHFTRNCGLQPHINIIIKFSFARKYSTRVCIHFSPIFYGGTSPHASEYTMTAILINFEIVRKLRLASVREIENWAWHLNFEKDMIETDILEARATHDNLEVLNLEEKLYDLTRDDFYKEMIKELDRRGLEQQYNELCYRTPIS